MLMRALRWRYRPWWRDLVDYYGVCQQMALALGTRMPGRRPLAFGGQTFEAIWHAAPRETSEQIAAFYRDVGPWLAFRQVVRHRRSRFDAIMRDLPRDGTLLEYGCGVAPVAFWIARRRWRERLRFVLADVPSEHLDFGMWRLDRLIRETRSPSITYEFESLPLTVDSTYPFQIADVAVCFETFEHVPEPDTVAAQILRTGCRVFWEDFIRDTPDVDGPDLRVAQERRAATYAVIRGAMRLTHGEPPETGQGRRRWVRR